MEIGISSFAETSLDPRTGETRAQDLRLRQLVEEIQLADQVGLDVFGVGEHHRPDYAVSAPTIVLAAAAAVTSRIRLSSAVTVLSSEDPVRVYQQFATLDCISNGRAEIMAGRGSFIESFPLFGQSLNDYDELFAEKLDLLLKVRSETIVSWSGKHRPSIDKRGVWPRAVQQPLPVWIASGGNRDSVIRAGTLGLPLSLAIIGGMPEQFAPLVQLYKQAAKAAGHNPDSLPVAVHSHGFLSEDDQEAADLFFPSTQERMNTHGRERGWPAYTRSTYDANRTPRGALFVGSPDYVIEKILLLKQNLGIDRFFMHLPIGAMPHDSILNAIRLLGNVVAPAVRAATGK
jgi:probable LLM family oxidoreductase